MMLKVSETVYSHLKAFSDADADLFGGDIYPMLAPMDAQYPFAVYMAEKTRPESKNGLFNIDLTIMIVGDDYDYLCAVSDSLEAYLRENFTEAHYQSTRPAFNEDKPREISFQIRYNLKMY